MTLAELTGIGADHSQHNPVKFYNILADYLSATSELRLAIDSDKPFVNQHFGLASARGKRLELENFVELDRLCIQNDILDAVLLTVIGHGSEYSASSESQEYTLELTVGYRWVKTRPTRVTQRPAFHTVISVNYRR